MKKKITALQLLEQQEERRNSGLLGFPLIDNAFAPNTWTSTKSVMILL